MSKIKLTIEVSFNSSDKEKNERYMRKISEKTIALVNKEIKKSKGWGENSVELECEIDVKIARDRTMFS